MSNTKRQQIKFNDDFSETGLTGFISWKRLKEILEKVQEIKSSENLNGFVITEDGINLQITYKPNKP